MTEKIVQEAKQKTALLSNSAQLADLKAKHLGKNSELAKALANLPNLPESERKKQGQKLNSIRHQLETVFQTANDRLISNKTYDRLDITAPNTNYKYGHLHPTTHVLKEIYQIFSHLGFAIVDGPEIETDWYNFESLNLPPDHPARDMQDTFYLNDQYQRRPLIARTHTSGMQVRFMESNKPPIKIIVPGKAYRNENEDRTHSWSFLQTEGLVVGEGVSMANLKGTLEHFVKSILGVSTKIRLRPSFFPYTEPSVEIDAQYKGEWLELLGAGMVHPQVLENAGIDSEKYSGFAFGVGIERLAQVKFDMTDLRENWRPNLNFLRAF